MRSILFSPILMLFLLMLIAKALMLCGRIQEQVTYAMDTIVSSVLVDTAYAASTSTDNTDVNPSNSLEEEEYDQKSKRNYTDATKINVLPSLTQSEMRLLKELSKRREKLEENRQKLELREQVLKATEEKLAQKLLDLETRQIQLEELMKQYDKKETNQILSLVKIYETMKPKDAANIFDELDSTVLFRVASNMKEVKLAPIIANMSTSKARELSMELAKQKSFE